MLCSARIQRRILKRNKEHLLSEIDLRGNNRENNILPPDNHVCTEEKKGGKRSIMELAMPYQVPRMCWQTTSVMRLGLVFEGLCLSLKSSSSWYFWDNIHILLEVVVIRYHNCSLFSSGSQVILIV